MRISENSLKWLMRFYPPMFFQRIWVRSIHKDFMGIDVKINRSVFTTNLGNSIFGGTIFSATDPFYALLFGQILRHKGYKITVWLKSAQIQYIKPGRTDLFYTIRITPSMIEEAEQVLKNEGKFVKTYPIEIFDKKKELCATAMNEIYVRDLNFLKLPDNVQKSI
ncbi:MAG: YiiD C-terminal domain-containing protein [Bacteroidia bacterium]|nr:YiiD C-terminal domain-containing protein [Bacteroidia bacterium]